MKTFVQVVQIHELESGPFLVSLENIKAYDIDDKEPSIYGKRMYIKLFSKTPPKVGRTFIFDDENILRVDKKGA